MPPCRCYTRDGTPRPPSVCIPAEVLFAGAAPTLVGMTQVNVRIPTTVPGTEPVPLTVQVGRYTPNQLAITIAVQ